jgi:hypothetical protein
MDTAVGGIGEGGMGMHLIASWPVLNVLAVAILTTVVLVDSRCRSLVKWLLLPALLEGAVVLFWLYART